MQAIHVSRKLIEVALPLDAINAASAREKSIRHGHPSTLHLWWARRPLAAARAVIFAQMVDDPSEYVDVLLSDSEKRRAAQRELNKRSEEVESGGGGRPALEEVLAQQERERLFEILDDLVRWENTTSEKVLGRARNEIWQSWRRACARNADHPRAAELFDRSKLPAFHDPFAGGGALPLEAQRLGLEAYASDLNPVAVLINKAMIEVPPKFAGCAPVHPEARGETSLVSKEWRGAQGLAEDVRRYGRWMRDEAEKRIGHLYPKVEITADMVRERPDLKPYEGRKLTVIAWLWARTVKSPNPAFADVEVPLVSTFMLSMKKGKEAYVEPVIERRSYRFKVKSGKPEDMETAKRGTKAGGSGSPFLCMLSGSPMPFDYLRTEAKAGGMGDRLMAIVVQGDRGRVYISPNEQQEGTAARATPQWSPDTDLPDRALGFRVQEYGMVKWKDLFTPRQLVALTTFSGLVGKASQRARRDAADAGLADDGMALREGGTGATAYAEAVALYLAFAVDYAANYWSVIATPADGFIRGTFALQAIPMTWDYAEAPPFGTTSGSWLGGIKWISKAIDLLPQTDRYQEGRGVQADATNQALVPSTVVSTDPPYYDNIGYADLSDFFYVWLRRSIKWLFPDLFTTLAVPKAEELVATPYRHGSRKAAESFFLGGMTQAFHQLTIQSHPGYPTTIYYAFKQSETKRGAGTSSTGWETFLDAVIQSGFSITGTWPIRTERGGRSISIGVNALASSIVLVCRRRLDDAPVATRGEFIDALRAELPQALRLLQTGNVAPVDLAQAAIGPGMAAYTRYAKVLDAGGKDVSVRDALALINQVLDEVLAEQEGDLDADSRWALEWFDQFGFDPGEYGVAETLSKAKNTSVEGLKRAGILEFGRGQVRLLRPRELPAEWDPQSDSRLTVWEMVHHLVRVLELGGELAAAALMQKIGSQAEAARELCYRLYTRCERKKRAADALAYNSLVQSWPEISRIAGKSSAVQSELLNDAQETS